MALALQSDSVPGDNTCKHLVKLSLEHGKPIMLDYYKESMTNSVVIGVRGEGESKEQMLIKNTEEWTSPIKAIYRVGQEFIVMTENSLYCVSSDIKQRAIK